MRDTRDAHYLHERRDIEPLVSPPIDEARALDWMPDREELIIGAAGGFLARVDPIMGTRTIAEGLGEPGALAVSPDGKRVAVLVRGVGLDVRDLETGACLYKVMEPLLADLWVGFWQQGLAFSGESLEGRRVVVVDRFGVVRARARLPEGAVVGVSKSGGLLVGRVSDEGVDVVPLGKPLQRRSPTSHRLRFSANGVLYGIAEGGVTVWASRRHPSTTVRVHGATCAALSSVGGKLAIGTRNGGITVTEVMADAPQRCHPGQTEGHDKPVQAIAFSHKGRWFATVGEVCWLWGY